MSQFHLRQPVYLFNSSRGCSRGFLWNTIQRNFIENFIRGRFSEVNFPWKRCCYLFSSFLFNSWPMRNRVGKTQTFGGTFFGGKKRKIPSFLPLFREKKKILLSPLFLSIFAGKLSSTRKKKVEASPFRGKSLSKVNTLDVSRSLREIFPHPRRIYRKGDIVSQQHRHIVSFRKIRARRTFPKPKEQGLFPFFLYSLITSRSKCFLAGTKK